VEVFITVAVKVTTSPQFDGVGEEVTIVDVLAGMIMKFAEPMLMEWFVSPGYDALAVAVPALMSLT
jgi:hypothetical protein